MNHFPLSLLFLLSLTVSATTYQPVYAKDCQDSKSCQDVITQPQDDDSQVQDGDEYTEPNGNGHYGGGHNGDGHHGGGHHDHHNGHHNGYGNGDDNGHDDDQVADSDKKDVDVLPLLFGHYDIKNKVVNLTGDDLPERRDHNGMFEPIFKSNLDKDQATVVLDDYREGFAVTQIREYDVGLGVARRAELDNISNFPNFDVSLIGIAATKGSSVRYERFIQDNKDIQYLETLPLPYKVEKLDKYNTGDRVMFESRGGVLFMGGFGNTPLYVGAGVLAEGGWKTYVKKESEDRALVKVAKTKVKKVSAHVGNVLMNASAEDFRELQNGFAFSFDFSLGKEETIKAYEELMKGNICVAQTLADLPYATGVSRVETFGINETTDSFGVGIGIPLVATASWRQSKVTGKTTRQFHEDGSTTKLNYGVYLRRSKGRFFHHHKEILKAFYSGVGVRVSEEDKQIGEGKKTSFVWRFENDWGKSWKLKQAVRLMKKDTGIEDAISLDVPKDKKLDFIRVKGEVPVTEEFTQTLLNMSGRTLENKLKSKAKDLLAGYFEKGTDPLELCDRNRHEDLMFCQRNLKYEAMSSIEDIREYVGKMKKNLDDPKDYTKYYSKVGKEMMNSQFVYNSVMSLDTNCRLNFDLLIEGRRINRIFRSFPANKDCR